MFDVCKSTDFEILRIHKIFPALKDITLRYFTVISMQLYMQKGNNFFSCTLHSEQNVGNKLDTLCVTNEPNSQLHAVRSVSRYWY
jgi:hypothetical protein